MVGNPYRWKATIPQLENRNATAGCLLAVLFIVPYLAKYNVMRHTYLAASVLIYVVLVVPLITGIMSKKTLVAFVRGWVATLTEPDFWKFLLRHFRYLAFRLHTSYVQLHAIHTTVMQIMLCLVAEKVICPEQRFCTLYVLFFYSVLAYLQKALQARPWTNLWNEKSAEELLRLTTAFIIARLGKGVAMSMILLTLTLQFDSMEPKLSFLIITLLFFSLTQYHDHPFLLNNLTHCLSYLHLQWLEGMEELWIPVLTSSVIICISVIMTMGCLFHTNSNTIALIACYTNVFVPIIIMLQDKWTPLSDEREKISRFPLATWKNSQLRSGVICAVCLDKLQLFAARVTKCGHLFHGSCLRVCLKYSNRCPLCKSNL